MSLILRKRKLRVSISEIKDKTKLEIKKQNETANMRKESKKNTFNKERSTSKILKDLEKKPFDFNSLTPEELSKSVNITQIIYQLVFLFYTKQTCQRTFPKRPPHNYSISEQN